MDGLNWTELKGLHGLINNKNNKQAGAELGQAQLKLRLDFNLSNWN